MIGSECYKKLKSLFIPHCPTKKTYKEITEALIKHYEPKVNEIAERYKFYKTEQRKFESVSDFIVKLKSLAQSCKFGNYLKNAQIYQLKLENFMISSKKVSTLNGQLININVLKLAFKLAKNYCYRIIS